MSRFQNPFNYGFIRNFNEKLCSPHLPKYWFFAQSFYFCSYFDWKMSKQMKLLQNQQIAPDSHHDEDFALIPKTNTQV